MRSKAGLGGGLDVLCGLEERSRAREAMVQLRNIFVRPSSPRKENLDHGVGIVFTPGPDDGLYVKYIVPDVRVL